MLRRVATSWRVIIGGYPANRLTAHAEPLAASME
jgi:hypothetical protein